MIAILATAAAVLALSGTAAAGVPVPDAGGSATVDSGVATTFTGTPNEPDGDPIVEGWVFEGNVVVGNPATWTFDAPGSFDATYWVFDSTDSANVSDVLDVTVLDVTPPVANAGADQTVDEDTLVTLDASLTTDNDPDFSSTGTLTWTFTDGTAKTLSGESPNYTFATPGTFLITLTAADAAGNTNTATTTVTVLDVTPPTASFSLASPFDEDTLQALDGTASSDNVGVVAWVWLIQGSSDSVTLSGATSSYTFTEPGTYQVTLTVADAALLTDSKTVTVTVLDVTPPTAYFEMPSTFGNDAQELNGSESTDNVGVVNWTWTIQDYTASETCYGVSDDYTWMTPGTYDVTLTVADAAGNTNAFTQRVTVTDTTPPQPSAGPDARVDEDTALTFDASASTDNDPAFPTGAAFTWSFYDGGLQTLTGITSSWTFASPGTYIVTLNATDAAGNTGVGTWLVVVLDTTPPTAAFSLDSPFGNDAQVLDGTGSTDNVGVVGWTWTIGDAGFTSTFTGATASYTWTSPGTFNVTLTATDAAGNSGSTTHTVTVLDTTPPTAEAGADFSVNQDAVASFDATATTDNDPAFPTGASFTWTFTDGGPQSLAGATATYTFATAGTYLVLLNVTDAAGNTGTDSVTVTVRDVTAPVAVFSLATPFNEDTAQALDGSGSTDNVGVVSWTWTIRGGTTSEILSGATASFTFANPGTYLVTLTVADAAGNTGATNLTVVALDITPPTPVLGLSTPFDEDTIQTLDATGSYDNVGVVTYRWAIHDTSGVVYSSDAVASHTWATPGTYTVELTVGDAAGNAATSSLNVTVRDVTAPAAAFSMPLAFDEDTAQSLDASLSSDNVGVVAWDWAIEGPGISAQLSGATTSYTFATPGTYTVRLTVHDAAGNAASAAMNVTARDVTPPQASLSVPATWPEDSAVTFDASPSTDNSLSFPEGATFTWTFNDHGPVTLTGQSVAHTFAEPGTYLINLVVVDGAGNRASASATLRVLDITPPSAAFSLGSPLDEDTAQTLDASLSTDNVGVTAFTWTVTDVAGPQTLTGAVTTYTWSQPGTYTVTLTVRDAAGNLASKQLSVEVLDVTAPTAAFTGPSSFAEDAAQAFDARISTDNVGVVSFAWTVTDMGQTFGFTGPALTYTWATPGTFLVTLVVRDAAGNSGTHAATVTARDVTPPTGTAVAPNSWPEDTTVTFSSAGVSDNDPNFATTRSDTWTFDDGGVPVSLSGTSPTYTFANPGNFAVRLVVRDAAGNAFEANFALKVLDTTPPSFIVQTPENLALVGTAQVTFTGLLETGAVLSINGMTAPTAGGRFDLTLLLNEGPNTVTFLAFDAAGNQRIETRLVVVDTQKPGIEVPAPGGGVPTHAASVTLSGRVTDPHTPTLAMNGQPVALAADGSFSVSFALAEGPNVANFVARDAVGNERALAVTVVRDSVPPTLGFHLEAAFLDTATPTTYDHAVALVGDLEAGASLQVCSDAPTGSLVCGNVTPGADGSYRVYIDLKDGATTTIVIKATDPAGNTATHTYTVNQAVAAAPPAPGLDLLVVSVVAAALAACLAVGLFLTRGKWGAPKDR